MIPHVARQAEKEDHDVPYDVKLFILEGSMKLAGRAYGPGDTAHLPARIVHTEEIGPDGVSFIACRRTMQPRARL